MKWLKWSLFALAGLVTLVCLFYAEENWRGARAWEEARKEAEARGVAIKTLEEVAPLPVRDSENFIAAPGVRQLFAKRKEGSPDPFEDDKFDISPSPGFSRGMPLDFIAWKADPENPYSQEGKDLSAEALYLEISSGSDGPRELLLAGIGRPYVVFPVDWSVKPASSVELPHLTVVMQAGKVLSKRASALLGKGETAEAFANIRIGARLIEGCRKEPTLISQLVAITVQKLMMQPLWEGLRDQKWSPPQLAWLQEELESWDWIESGRWTLTEGEPAFGIDCIEWTKEASARDINAVVGVWDTSEDVTEVSWLARATTLVPDGWFDQNKAAYIREMTAFVMAAYPKDQPGRVDFEGSKRAESAFEGKFASNLFNPYFFFVRMTIPAVTGAHAASAGAQCWRSMAIIAIALERYALDQQGRYPDTLNILVPKYLAAVPFDPLDGKPIHYQKTSQGRYKLWCIGLNLKDDGARIVADRTDPKRVAKNEGDWVWSYEPLVPVKSETVR
jgi:hypothetical protein